MPALGLTSNTTPAPFVASASDEIPSTAGDPLSGGLAWNAFSGNVNYIWHANGSAAWIQIDFGPGAAFRVASYEISVENFSNQLFPDRDPVNWTVEGSNNLIDWDVLDTVSGQTWGSFFNPGVPARRSYTCDVVGAGHRYLKLNISQNGGSPFTIITAWDFGPAAKNRFYSTPA
jgi:hypothetical protein